MSVESTCECGRPATHFNDPATNKKSRTGHCRDCFELKQSRFLRASVQDPVEYYDDTDGVYNGPENY